MKLPAGHQRNANSTPSTVFTMRSPALQPDEIGTGLGTAAVTCVRSGTVGVRRLSTSS
ncbi:MAG: hypothetical protein Q4C96_10545 [Planctomycetia bacterium]|nr:hypothetical protein [Planctomycetia bacterium]